MEDKSVAPAQFFQQVATLTYVDYFCVAIQGRIVSFKIILILVAIIIVVIIVMLMWSGMACTGCYKSVGISASVTGCMRLNQDSPLLMSLFFSVSYSYKHMVNLWTFKPLNITMQPVKAETLFAGCLLLRLRNLQCEHSRQAVTYTSYFLGGSGCMSWPLQVLSQATTGSPEVSWNLEKLGILSGFHQSVSDVIPLFWVTSTTTKCVTSTEKHAVHQNARGNHIS